MSVLLILSFGALTFFLISQFGGKLTARNSLVWWLIFGFLLWCVISPGSLLPVAHLLGVQLVSNFVLATMILFLAFQAIQESAYTTLQSRKLRDLVSSFAAESFYTKFKANDVAVGKPRVLIGMPCFNEELHLPKLQKEIESFLSQTHGDSFEYIFCIINDGSIDGCRKFLDEKLPLSSTHHLSNVGVAGAMLSAFKAANFVNAQYVIQCDSDGQHPIEAIPSLVHEANRLGADLLIGSRYTEGLSDQSSTGTRRLGSKIIIATLQILFGKSEISDPTSGFRIYSKRAQRYLLQTMPDEYPEPETIALLLTQNMMIKEIPVKMLARQTGVSSLNGLAGARFMVKVLSALLGLRLRTLV
jgi:hypothetical protein